jgi:mevalonate pyrophosphate decarboxylase
MLPLNDSLSLSIDALRASTTVRTRRAPDSQDTVAINGREIQRGDSQRFERVFAVCRGLE